MVADLAPQASQATPPAPPLKRKRGIRRPHDRDTRDNARKLFLSGLNLKQVADTCGIPFRTIADWSRFDGWTSTTEHIGECATAVARAAKKVAMTAERVATQRLEGLMPMLADQATESLLNSSLSNLAISERLKVLTAKALKLDDLDTASRVVERTTKISRTTLGLDSDGVQLKLAVGIRLESTSSPAPIEVEIIEVNPTSTPLGQVDVEKV